MRLDGGELGQDPLRLGRWGGELRDRLVALCRERSDAFHVGLRPARIRRPAALDQVADRAGALARRHGVDRGELDVVLPEYLEPVLSCGVEESLGHPHRLLRPVGRQLPHVAAAPRRLPGLRLQPGLAPAGQRLDALGAGMQLFDITPRHNQF